MTEAERGRMLSNVLELPFHGCLWEQETEVREGGRPCSRPMRGAVAWPRWG